MINGQKRTSLLSRGGILMSKNKRKRSTEKNIPKAIVGLVIGLILLLGVTQLENVEQYINNGFNEKSVGNTLEQVVAKEFENVVLNNEETFQIHFFDVGQADSILLISNGQTMLIDAGNNNDGELVVNNIKKLGIAKIDYLIGTHPHADHIGGLDDVINNLDIGQIYMPNIQTNTKTFEDVLDAISNKGLKVTTPEEGYKFNVGNIECEVILNGKMGTKNNLNLASIVIRAEYKEQSYLFMGDAENKNEETITWKQTNVLKVGHHGSSTSSSESFLNQIKPQIAIIQVGKDNNYNHPTKQILDRLNILGTKIYRTDENGNILIESDGINNKVSFY